jgi:hypothetical protein
MRQTLRKIVTILDGKPKGRRGQSLFEMTVIAPLLIGMILGLTEIAFLANNYLILMDAVREAGRKAVNLFPTKWDPYVPDTINTPPQNDYYDTADDRNYDRTDCDTKAGRYNLYGDSDSGNDRNGNSADSIIAQYGGGGLGATWVSGTGWTTPPGDVRISESTTGQYNKPYKLSDFGYGVHTHPGSSVSDSGFFGFFDTVSCQLLYSMQPLILDVGYFPDVNGYPSRDTGKDEIVISAVAYSMMSNPTGNLWNGHHVAPVVTGRWPMENRACYKESNFSSANGFTDTTASQDSKGDYRDPFNYINPRTTPGYGNFITTSNHGVPPAGTTPFVDQDSVALTKSGPTPTGLDGLTTNGPNPLGMVNGIRGFIITGAYVAQDGCLGSEFRVQDIESMLDLYNGGNLPKPNYPTMDPLQANLESQFAPNGGMVIVELHWQHHPAFFGPIFEGFTGHRDADPILNIYGIFPVTAAEPTVTP